MSSGYWQIPFRRSNLQRTPRAQGSERLVEVLLELGKHVRIKLRLKSVETRLFGVGGLHLGVQKCPIVPVY
jgi:hypothetical protein